METTMSQPSQNRRSYRGEDTRQGHIVLRSARRKIVFIAGLSGIVLLALLLAL